VGDAGGGGAINRWLIRAQKTPNEGISCQGQKRRERGSADAEDPGRWPPLPLISLYIDRERDTCFYPSVYLSIYLYIHTYIHIYIYMYLYYTYSIYIDTRRHTYINRYVCICICICIYIYIWEGFSRRRASWQITSFALIYISI